MPLVKIFARSTLSKPVPLAALQSKLCDIWGTKPNTTKLMLQVRTIPRRETLPWAWHKRSILSLILNYSFRRYVWPQRVEDWTDDSFQEDCYVDIRAYGE
jgi:hypothetical protein